MTTETRKETLGFQAEVKQLLQLMIHSLYSNKEIFLRELISNASDAADKLRFEAISKPQLLEGDAEPRVRVSFDTDAKTVTVEDNGPGVSAEMREQMFMPFITTKEMGLGLGLVISADIAREFGGELRLEPEGQGAAFTVELPRAAA